MIKLKCKDLLGISDFYDFYTLSIESMKVRKILSYSNSKKFKFHFDSKRIIGFFINQNKNKRSIQYLSKRRYV